MQTEGQDFLDTESVIDNEDDVQYGKPDEILFFTNRFEIGQESCYEKLNKASKVLGAVSHEEFKKADQASRIEDEVDRGTDYQNVKDKE